MPSPFIEFHCEDHGWICETFSSAQVTCHCKKLCRPISEQDKGLRKKALTARRVGLSRKRTALHGNAVTCGSSDAKSQRAAQKRAGAP